MVNLLYPILSKIAKNYIISFLILETRSSKDMGFLRIIGFSLSTFSLD
jgi:hypothetical protein